MARDEVWERAARREWFLNRFGFHKEKRPPPLLHGLSMTWFDRDPERLTAEVELMRRSTRATLRRAGDQLVWTEEIASTATGQPYLLAIRYPERFPHEAPKAYILEPDVTGAPHRFGDGSLCLWANWVAGSGVGTTALMVRGRAIVWFLAYEVWRVTGQWMAPSH